MNRSFPPRHMLALVQQSRFPTYIERFGPMLHDIVNEDVNTSDDDIWSALNSVLYWKQDLNRELSTSQQWVTAFATMMACVNSSGFLKYFETEAADTWPVVQEVIQQGGSDELRQAFDSMLSVFPDGHPATELQQRLQQLDDLQDAGSVDADEWFDVHGQAVKEAGGTSDATLWRALRSCPNEQYFPPGNEWISPDPA
ncbi:hypothetical protein Mal4_00380 [Maioricimonas rarisocia]|uniref:DNA mimic protein DMP19 C-terminal domain-containing protein n=1 Tax=Maioricimonas rarisocia TaxID=2528026 RepID=A0A517YZT2_9PLAN|nr:DUF4375 domain-containing protein [Maioricimonas rarisocia]QDU35756.1 hypothetical protein Mal4_00380 [Maioricimonas rarisocia]